MMTPIFAFLSDAKEAMTELVTGLLMIAGGFLVGYILGGIIAWAVGRYILKHKDTQVLKRLGRPIGGVLLALIVALIVFTGKGKPHGEGGDGKGVPDQNPGTTTQPKVDPKADPKTPVTKFPDPKPADLTIWVTILEGAASPSQGKFYRLEGDDAAKSLEEVKAALLDRKAKATGKVALGLRFDKNTPPGDPRLVTDVTNWATSKAVGLDVTLTANQ